MDFQKFGPNDIRIEGDLVFSVVHGVPSLADTRRFLDLVADVASRHGSVVMLTDVTEGFGLSPETRRYTAEWSRDHTIAASALFGASSATRAMLMLVFGAMRVFGKSVTNTRFFVTEQESRAWLNLHRATPFRK
jgi:hypothetical protein